MGKIWDTRRNHHILKLSGGTETAPKPNPRPLESHHRWHEDKQGGAAESGTRWRPYSTHLAHPRCRGAAKGTGMDSNKD